MINTKRKVTKTLAWNKAQKIPQSPFWQQELCGRAHGELVFATHFTLHPCVSTARNSTQPGSKRWPRTAHILGSFWGSVFLARQCLDPISVRSKKTEGKGKFSQKYTHFPTNSSLCKTVMPCSRVGTSRTTITWLRKNDLLTESRTV